MSAMWRTRGGAAVVLVAAVLCFGCGEFVRQSQSPSQLVIDSILTAAGTSGVPTSFSSRGPLLSDVADDNGTIFDDFAQINLSAILRDPGTSGFSPTAPGSLNAVTITRYTVTYTRSGGPNGQNTPGVDVPRPIEGAVTATIGNTGFVVIELVRHVAKLEAPLFVLVSSPEVLTMIAEVTLYGRDQAGNGVSASGDVQINFANFAG